jgi:hypothetical protein
MRRVGVAVLLAVVALAPEPVLLAKFGISKTRITLPRLRPPDNPPMAESVALEVRAATSEVTGSHVSIVQGRLDDALHASGLYRLEERTRDADAVIKVTLDSLRAEVRDEIRMERKRVKVGEKQVWNEKKKKYEKEDVYADRDVPETWRIAEGSIGATVAVEGGRGSRPTDAGATYNQEFKKSDHVPIEATTEESLKRFLVMGVAERAVGAVTFAPDPVEALLAVNGELKDGNKLAEAGLFQEALGEWTRKTYKGDTEAARLHNVGVAHEALAYRLQPHDPEHRKHLEQAQDLYNQARTLDPDEKYFRDPLVRIQVSLGYADSAARIAADLQRFKDDAAGRRRGSSAPSSKAPTPAKTGGPSNAPAAPAKTTPTTGGGSPLKNGSFESSLAPWALTGKGSIVEEAGRGRVLEIVPGASEASAQQAIGVDLEASRGATLSLDYKVASGEAQVRALIGYADASGKDRSATLQVTGGEGPGGWAPWQGDVAAIRPRPARVKEVRIAVSGGTVRVDNVALTLR